MQDERAEDPLTAAKAGAAADYELYWTNKLRKPLSEILITCLAPAQLQARTLRSLGPGHQELRRVDQSPVVVTLCAHGKMLCLIGASDGQLVML